MGVSFAPWVMRPADDKARGADSYTTAPRQPRTAKQARNLADTVAAVCDAKATEPRQNGDGRGVNLGARCSPPSKRRIRARAPGFWARPVPGVG
jgi:hypothetical protein